MRWGRQTKNRRKVYTGPSGLEADTGESLCRQLGDLSDCPANVIELSLHPTVWRTCIVFFCRLARSPRIFTRQLRARIPDATGRSSGAACPSNGAGLHLRVDDFAKHIRQSERSALPTWVRSPIPRKAGDCRAPSWKTATLTASATATCSDTKGWTIDNDAADIPRRTDPHRRHEPLRHDGPEDELRPANNHPDGRKGFGEAFPRTQQISRPLRKQRAAVGRSQSV